MTGNPGKLSEAQAQLEPLGYEIVGDGRGYPEIQADSLEEVCRFGLDQVRDQVEGVFMLEDAGLFVEALEGFPGVYSSFAFATLGNEGVLKLLEGRSARAARFESVIGFHDGSKDLILNGTVEGQIAAEPRGEGGFGFDPIFVPEGSKRTFAEMTPEEKKSISHRARALDELVAHLDG